jgi:hypothetical protein
MFSAVVLYSCSLGKLLADDPETDVDPGGVYLLLFSLLNVVGFLVLLLCGAITWIITGTRIPLVIALLLAAIPSALIFLLAALAGLAAVLRWTIRCDRRRT